MSQSNEKELTEFEKNLVESIYENIEPEKLKALGKLFRELSEECEDEFDHLFGESAESDE